MKIIIIFSFALVSLLTCKKSAAQIPNNSFENWENVAFQLQSPTGWDADNSPFDFFNLLENANDPNEGSHLVPAINFYESSEGENATIKLPSIYSPFCFIWSIAITCCKSTGMCLNSLILVKFLCDTCVVL